MTFSFRLPLSGTSLIITILLYYSFLVCLSHVSSLRASFVCGYSHILEEARGQQWVLSIHFGWFLFVTVSHCDLGLMDWDRLLTILLNFRDLPVSAFLLSGWPGQLLQMKSSLLDLFHFMRVKHRSLFLCRRHFTGHLPAPESCDALCVLNT